RLGDDDRLPRYGVRQVRRLGAITPPAGNPCRGAGRFQLRAVRERDVVRAGVDPGPGGVLPLDAEPAPPRVTLMVHCDEPVMVVHVGQRAVRLDLDLTEVSECAARECAP